MGKPVNRFSKIHHLIDFEIENLNSFALAINKTILQRWVFNSAEYRSFIMRTRKSGVNVNREMKFYF